MAHLINFSNERANMAYVGKTPWHGLGQQLTEDAPIEVWAQEAGFEHTIKVSPVHFEVEDWEIPGRRWVEEHPARNILYHSTTFKPLGVVSDRYHVVQPREVLEFYRDLVEASGDFQLETAGILDEGQRYWALAKYREELVFCADTVKPYLLLATSCDGSMATRAQFTSVRVVCHNTLQASMMDDAPTNISIPHSRMFNATAVKEQLNISTVIAGMNQAFSELMDKAMSRQRAVDIFIELTIKRDGKGNVSNEDSVKRISEELYMSLTTAPGADLETARDTAWGGLNAVTHYVDHKAPSHSDNNRFKSGQLGNGAAMKERAFHMLMAA